MFIDYAKIYVKAGQGGSGACSFRREKHVPKGGPSGGDGGLGGSIIFIVDPHLRTLVDFNYKKHYVAKHGQHGMGSNKYGRAAENIYVKVPVGTLVRNAADNRMIADLVTPGVEYVVARGGHGGRGNAHFSTSTNRAPREWEVGEAGEEKELVLELKLIADIGLVGKPNAGKSTLLSKISAARPKIADYPFTTLQPNLGIVRADEYKSMVFADIPGLIEGAHTGKGLGIQFLKHIERTRLLIFMIDPTDGDPVETFEVLMRELGEHSDELIKKPFVIVLTKKDIWEEDFLKEAKGFGKKPLFAISSMDGAGLNELKWKCWSELEKLNIE